MNQTIVQSIKKTKKILIKPQKFRKTNIITMMRKTILGLK